MLLRKCYGGRMKRRPRSNWHHSPGVVATFLRHQIQLFTRAVLCTEHHALDISLLRTLDEYQSETLMETPTEKLMWKKTNLNVSILNVFKAPYKSVCHALRRMRLKGEIKRDIYARDVDALQVCKCKNLTGT